jgi:putative peptide zinc metalloprotease protein
VAQAYAPPAPRRSVFLLDDEPVERTRLPALAEGVELIGRYEGSGFEEAPFLAKRRDGQVIQLTRLLYLVAEELRPDGDAQGVADRVSRAYGRDVSADNVEFLVQKKLRQTGLVATPEADHVPMQAPNPLLALKLRLPLVPERVHRHVTNALKPLFWPPLVVVAVLAMIALDVWLITDLGSGLILAAQLVIYQPQLLVPVTALTIAMVAFHEIGHASAARYGGAHPGAMGMGIYLVWPVFYTDVTDVYRLDRRGRLRVDLGGVYFNTLFTLAVAGLYVATDHVVFVVFLVVAQLESLRQFLPFVRLDGYYVVCDMAGVPNLFEYVKPAMARLVRRTRGSVSAAHAAGARRFETLTRRARIVLTVWALVTAPVLIINIAVLLFTGPRFAGSAFGSASRQVAVLSDAVHRGSVMDVVASVIGIVFLILPIVGTFYLVYRVSGRVRAAVVRWWGVRPAATAALVAVVGTGVLFQVGFVWPETFAAAARPPQPEQLTTETRHIPREPVPGGAMVVAELPPIARASAPAPVPIPAPPAPAPDPEPLEAEPEPAPPATAPAPAPVPVAPSTTVTPVPDVSPAGPTPAPTTPTTAPPSASPSTTATTAPPSEPSPTTSTTLWSPLHDLLSFLPE